MVPLRESEAIEQKKKSKPADRVESVTQEPCTLLTQDYSLLSNVIPTVDVR